ncbi:uncharacterized protein L969DRAFT_43729 [Mixia osmundae IAM 14324]|uniref:Uncharacterized protein n=1 Tax=Mixia osmundae (strain CBS 9802 / IAM 14324 / JCM 22182 / KY 12970) TaxID=764103 RepID=G7E7D1_MIXOS|nr:uncharacterized protein L969DRAFT_43729 [Mixia osmundae IAM 14324]KEI42708.1 hypothetical protein L969DRAFT_43729 [Mixia osmundae IAM 14324]GAA98741.1 hypothetical protein E5Q_05429 [Mixia osmundae IAM 14324]
MSRPLDPSSLLARVSQSVPHEARLEKPIAVLAVLLHAIHVSLGFRLVSPQPGTDGVELPSAILASGKDSFAFKYRHEQSSMEFELHVHRLGGRGVANAIATEDDRTASLDIALLDYFSPSSLPWPADDAASSEPSTSAGGPSSSSGPAPEHLFIHLTRLKDLTALYQLRVIQRLIPGLRKEGYSEIQEEDTQTTQSQPVAQPGGRGGYYPDPGGPILPVGPQPSREPRSPLRAPDRTVPDIGRSDLLPLGGLGGTTNPSRDGRFTGGDGMLVGPDHPLFRDRFASDPNNLLAMPGRNGPTGPWGGDGFLPPMGAPPGARFDPVGPGQGIPRPRGPNGPFGGGSGGFGGSSGGFGGGSGGFGGRVGGDPDNDEFMPPGSNPEYDNMFS